MDKASGVYLTITDNSFITGGTTQMKVIVPMLTNKGNIGITRVTANTFKDLVGYDLGYNSNYYGLQKLLENMTYLDVWRINQNAKIANAYFLDKNSNKSSSEDCDSFDEITKLDPAPLLAAAQKYAGNWQTTALKFTPNAEISTQPNEGANDSNSQTMVFDDVREAEKTMFDGMEISGGCVFYNSSDNAVVGVIKQKEEDGKYYVYKVVDNEIIDDVVTYKTTNVWTDGTNFYDALMQAETEPGGEAGEPVSIGTVRSGDYTAVVPAWQLGATYYNESVAEIEPEGTHGTGNVIGKGYFPTTGDEHLNPDYLYMTADEGQTFYKVLKLAATWEEMVVNVDKIMETDSTALADLVAIYTDSGNLFKNVTHYEFSSQKNSGFYVNKGGFWFKATGFNKVSISDVGQSETNSAIINALEGASDVEISFVLYTEITHAEDNSVGGAIWDGSKLTVTLTKPMSKDSFWTVHTIPEIISEWTLSVGKFEEDQYLIQNQYAFSTNSDSEVYWKNVNFGNVDLFLSGVIPGDWATVRNWFTLDNGTNGSQSLSAADLDTSVLDTCGDNILLMNGLTDLKVVNRIVSKCQALKIHAFVDIPAYSAYIDAETWANKVTRGEYIAVAGRPDQAVGPNDGVIYVYPSVNYGCIFAAMMKNYGNLCFPPAGPTYGIISADDLITCDYEMYQNELKTNRINWQRTNSLGTMMWEQRTTYSLNTDLSYIAPVFIVDDLSDQIVTFERQFNFRYMTRSDLLTQESGLTSIFDSFVTKGFVFAYEIKMPTYEEAQRSGRVLRVPLKVQIAKDSEVIELELEITNSL